MGTEKIKLDNLDVFSPAGDQIFPYVTAPTKSIHSGSSSVIETSSPASSPQRVRIRLWSSIYFVFCAAVMSYLTGITLSYASPTVLQLTQLEDEHLRFTATLSDIFGASSYFGSVIGALLAGYVADKGGRKTSLALTCVPFMTGYFLIMSSYLITIPSLFRSILIIGRAITGIGLGWSYTIVPIYISEVVAKRFRGFFIAVQEVALSTGVLTVHGLSSIPNFHYYELALVPIGAALIFIVIFLWVPETPRWLLIKHDKKQAISVLKYMLGPQNKQEIEKVIEEIRLSVPTNNLNLVQALRQIFCTKSIFVPFSLVVFLALYYQFSGVPLTTAYVGYIFSKAGDPNPNFTAFFASGLMFIIGSILCTLAVDLAGRKLILALSAAGMCIASTMLGFHNYFTRPSLCRNTNQTNMSEDSQNIENCNFYLFPMVVTGVVLFNISFGFGLASVLHVFNAEYIPVEVKGVAGGILVSLNRVTGGIVTGTYLNFTNWAGDHTLWWIFAVVNFVSIFITSLCLIETKGKTLEEVPELFRKKYRCLRNS